MYTIMGDNTGAITLTKEARFHNSMKCIRLSEHLTRELVQQKTISRRQSQSRTWSPTL